jgi:hypothetical protein
VLTAVSSVSDPDRQYPSPPSRIRNQLFKKVPVVPKQKNTGTKLGAVYVLIYILWIFPLAKFLYRYFINIFHISRISKQKSFISGEIISLFSRNICCCTFRLQRKIFATFDLRICHYFTKISEILFTGKKLINLKKIQIHNILKTIFMPTQNYGVSCFQRANIVKKENTVFNLVTGYRYYSTWNLIRIPMNWKRTEKRSCGCVFIFLQIRPRQRCRAPTPLSHGSGPMF